MMTNLIFVTLTIIAAIGIWAGCMIAILPHGTRLSKLTRIGVTIAMLGLCAQVFRNIMFLVTGVSPADSDLPLWALKDIGVTIILLSLMLAVAGKIKIRLKTGDDQQGE